MPVRSAALKTEGHGSLAARLDRIDWEAMARDLAAHGRAVIGPLFMPAECAALAALYPQDKPFRSRVIMQRHEIGRAHV